MAKGRNRELAAPALVLAGAGVAAGATLGGILARRRRQMARPSSEATAVVARRLLEEPWQGGTDVVAELVSADYVGHDPAEPDPILGVDGVRASIEKYRAAFPDGAITVDEQLVDGTRVASRWTAHGTHLGEIAGIAPTGRQATVFGLTVFRIENGKAVEGWTSWDRLGLLVQLGAVPEPAHAS